MSARAGGTRVTGAAWWAGRTGSPPPGTCRRTPRGRAGTPRSQCAATRQRQAGAESEMSKVRPPRFLKDGLYLQLLTPVEAGISAVEDNNVKPVVFTHVVITPRAPVLPLPHLNIVKNSS